MDFSTDDRFCLDGHRLVLESGTYGSGGAEYRTETNSFRRVTSHGTAGTGPSYFVVESKGGMTQYYGNTTDSKIEAQGMSTVRVWALNRVEDAAGNYYAITYHEDNAEGAFYPTQIDYTGNDSAGLLPNAMVEFTYEDRQDHGVRWEGGAKITDHPKRLTNIKTYVDLALVSDYELDYHDFGLGSWQDGGKVSRLSRIVRCDASDICQDSVSFDWLEGGWHGDLFDYSEITVPANRNRVAGYGAGSRFRDIDKALEPRWHDLNGDGTPDYVLTDYGVSSLAFPRYSLSGNFEVMLSGPTGYQTANWTGGFAGSNIDDDDLDTYWADIDGDGRTDIVNVEKDGNDREINVSLSTGSGFTTSIWLTHTEGAYNDEVDIAFLDMNGDKLLDLVIHEVEDAPYFPATIRLDGTTSTDEDGRVLVYLNTGTGFGSEQIWADEIDLLLDLADMNGDGLTDLVENMQDVRLNDGNGFGVAVNWPTTGASSTSSSASLFDYNADGKVDRYWSSRDEIHINTGAGFINLDEDSVYPPYVDLNGNGRRDTFSRTIAASGSRHDLGKATIVAYFLHNAIGASAEHEILEEDTDYLNSFAQAADIDGDGIYELTFGKTWVCDDGGGTNRRNWEWCDETQVRIYKADTAQAHLLETITTQGGYETTFTYAPLTDHSIYTKYNTSTLPELDVQDSTHVVKTLTQDNGAAGDFDIHYTYEGLKRDLDGRGLLGFAKITATDERRGIITATEYAQTFPYSSRPTYSETRRSDNNQLLSDTTTSYSLIGTVGAGTVFPYVDTRIVKAYDPDDGRLLSTTTTTNHTVDAYGNIEDTEVEVVDHENSDTFTTQTLSTYSVDLTDWFVGQLTSQTTKAWRNGSYSSALDRTNSFTYEPSTGFLATSTQEPGKGAGIELTKSLSYDSFGNVQSETISGPGITSRTTSMTYDIRGQFPETVTNAKQHVMSRTWDSKFGNKLSETSINNVTTTWSYNGFGQLVMEFRPDGTTTEIRYYKDDVWWNPSASTLYKEVIATGVAPVREYYDGKGRTVHTRTQGFDGSYVNVETEYDSQGRVDRVSEPYFDGNAPSNSSSQWNVTTYDYVGRVIGLNAVDDVKSVTTDYDGFTVTITDNMNRSEVKTVNAVGQVIQVIDRIGTTMTFGYDPVGNRVQVTNAVGTGKQSTVTYTYDRLGRMLTQNDPDHGLYTYTYDALGQKLSEQSPKMAAATPSPQIRTFTYDVLGRMTSRTEPEGTSTWTYDDTTSGNLGKGQLHSESMGTFSRTYEYGSGDHGRLTGTRTVIDGMIFDTEMAYNSDGQLESETYPGSTKAPSGFEVKYNYNAVGYLERVRQKSGAFYYQLVETDASGRPTREWRGDGTTTYQAYESASGRVTSQGTTTATTIIQNFSYRYDDAGNMIERKDDRLGLEEDFTFDDLDRLTGAQVTGQTAAVYDFDIKGNITHKSDTGNPYSYTGTQAHAVTQIDVGGGTLHNLSYDDNGNLSGGDDAPTITWSSYNKPTQLTKGGITYDFFYGPDRKRYKKVKGTETTYYIGESFERIDKPTSTEYRHVIRANGKAIMLRKDYSAGGLAEEIIHQDRLGSITALTDRSTGSVIERYSYDAWGQRRDATTWAAASITAYEKRGYTGHEHLDDIGIIHMNGRVYDPRLGRMLSPDPVTQAPENGQNYNRYTYAFNNPFKYSDPSGFISEVVVTAPAPSGGGGGGGGFKSVRSASPELLAQMGLEKRLIDVEMLNIQNELNKIREANADLEETLVTAPNLSIDSTSSSTMAGISPAIQSGDGSQEPIDIVRGGGIDCTLEDCTKAVLNEPETPNSCLSPESCYQGRHEAVAAGAQGAATASLDLMISELMKGPSPVGAIITLSVQGSMPANKRSSGAIFATFVSWPISAGVSIAGLNPAAGLAVGQSTTSFVERFYYKFLTPKRIEDYPELIRR